MTRDMVELPECDRLAFTTKKHTFKKDTLDMETRKLEFDAQRRINSYKTVNKISFGFFNRFDLNIEN